MYMKYQITNREARNPPQDTLLTNLEPAIIMKPVLGTVAVSVIVTAVLAVATFGGDAAATGGTYVDSVTFAKQPDEEMAITALLNDQIDIYYLSISDDLAQQVRGAGHQVYQSTGGTTYAIEVNPTDEGTMFNPFSLQEARLALHYMIDREDVVNSLLGAGAPILSVLTPQHPDYLLTYRDLESLGIRYDLAEANRLMSGALAAAGATMSGDGKWHHGGEPITVIILIRNDDVVRTSIGEMLADSLEDVGLTVTRTYGDLLDAYSIVYNSDPREQEWHLYTGAWSGSSVVKYDDSRLASYYAPWAGNTPGFNEPDYWNYENELLDDTTYKLYTENYDSLEERADLVRRAVVEAVTESVRVFIATQYESYAARGDITGVVNVQGNGIANRYTPINVQLPQAGGNLDIGVRHVSQSSWNPVQGLADSYSTAIWSLLTDSAAARDPHNADLVPSRASWTVTTAGPDGKLTVPADAIMWNPAGQEWTNVSPSTMATSKVTLDFKLANWHHGQMMDINDVLYTLYFVVEWGTEHGDSEAYIEDLFKDLTGQRIPVAVRILDDDTIEVYTDEWHSDEAEIAARGIQWSTLPWELYAAMEQAVRERQTAFSGPYAQSLGVSWLSMIDPADAELIRSKLVDFRANTAIPEFLPLGADADYVNQRYDAAIAWIDDKNHAVIGGGPFYLDWYARESGSADGAIDELVVRQFDDPTYPLPPGHWDAFALSERLSGDIRIGSLAPESGGASNYGQDIRAASELAVEHFNEYLDIRGESWSLAPKRLDTMTNPQVALDHIMALNRDGIKLVDGPAIDLVTDTLLQYASQNDMVLVSCCSALPSLAHDDGLFRMVPNHNMHGKAIADEIYQNGGVQHIIPVGINNPWATELLEAAVAEFESGGSGYSAYEIITYDGSAEIPAAAAELAAVATAAAAAVGPDRVAVLYIGFEEGQAFMGAASQHDVLWDLRWFGADQNTASPNVGDDPISAEFAEHVGFTVLQPTVPDNQINDEIRTRVISELGREPSPYASYEYNAVWLLGLSLLNAQSIDPSVIKETIPEVASRYVGAVGSSELDGAGDLLDADYQVWTFVDGQWSDAPAPDTGGKKKACR